MCNLARINQILNDPDHQEELETRLLDVLMRRMQLRVFKSAKSYKTDSDSTWRRVWERGAFSKDVRYKYLDVFGIVAAKIENLLGTEWKIYTYNGLKIRSKVFRTSSSDAMVSMFKAKTGLGRFSRKGFYPVEEGKRILHFNWMGDLGYVLAAGKITQWCHALDCIRTLNPDIAVLWVNELGPGLQQRLKAMLDRIRDKPNTEYGDELGKLVIAPIGIMLKQIVRFKTLKHLVPIISMEMLKKNYVNVSDIVRVLNVLLYGGIYLDFPKEYEFAEIGWGDVDEADRDGEAPGYWDFLGGYKFHFDTPTEDSTPMGNDMYCACPGHPVMYNILKLYVANYHKNFYVGYETVGHRYRLRGEMRSAYGMINSDNVNRFFFLFTMATTGPTAIKTGIFNNNEDFTRSRRKKRPQYVTNLPMYASGWKWLDTDAPPPGGKQVIDAAAIDMLIQLTTIHLELRFLIDDYRHAGGPDIYDWKHNIFFQRASRGANGYHISLRNLFRRVIDRFVEREHLSVNTGETRNACKAKEFSIKQEPVRIGFSGST